MKKTIVKIVGQSRNFTNQVEARAWARRLLDAEVTFLEISEGDDDGRSS